MKVTCTQTGNCFSSYTDAAILHEMAAGNTQSFDYIFQKYYSVLCVHAHAFFGHVSGAEDAVADVFARIWEKRDKIQIDSSLKSYLYRSVTNQCIDVLRKAYHQRVSLSEDVASGFDSADNYNLAQEISARELGQQLELAIRSLPPKCKMIFRLSREGGLKYHEIATHLGISIKTVETQMGRAFKTLRAVVPAQDSAAA